MMKKKTFKVNLTISANTYISKTRLLEQIEYSIRSIVFGNLEIESEVSEIVENADECKYGVPKHGYRIIFKPDDEVGSLKIKKFLGVKKTKNGNTTSMYEVYCNACGSTSEMQSTSLRYNKSGRCKKCTLSKFTSKEQYALLYYLRFVKQYNLKVIKDIIYERYKIPTTVTTLSKKSKDFKPIVEGWFKETGTLPNIDLSSNDIERIKRLIENG